MLKLFWALPFVLAIGYYSYLNYEQFVAMNYLSMIPVVVFLVLIYPLVSFLHVLAEDRIPLYKRIYRLWLTANFLNEQGFYYEKASGKQGGRSKKKFPKVYLKQGKYDLRLYLGTQGSKFQDRFSRIGSELETTYFMDFMNKIDEEKFVVYELAYSAFLNRIEAKDVVLNDNYELVLSKVVKWSMTENPHLLIVGGTGGGKTVLLREILVGLLKKCIVYIGDPKRADFVPMEDLDVLKGRVFFEKEDIAKMVGDFKQTMNNRYDYMRKIAKERSERELGRFDTYGLKPTILMIDEWNALMASLNRNAKVGGQMIDDLLEIILKGRQVGSYVILAMQKPTYDDLPTKLRDNMMHHISMGRLSDSGYQMTFGDENANKKFRFIERLNGKKVYGRGYSAIFGLPAQEFYAPNLTAGFSFFDIFETYSRIENPHEPNYQGDVDKEDDVETQDLIDLDEPIDLPIQTLSDSTDFKTIGELSKSIGKSFGQIKKLIDVIEKGGFKKFKRDNGKVVLTEEDCLLLEGLFDSFESFDGTWKEMVSIHFDRDADN
ncbi:FtsK/SpoIIIE domain-containing protein [Streptococcus raffinosi]|uniref:FtsK/SpoIIIE domain-containing protein n=1 Tax=Streptococcus raffinosi TaxID=3053355 RepID=A0ABT7LPP9_9STRE|nr:MULTISPECIES: FtsK/SpoIIIE domain-containing protein [unclassified Streptococcus]MDL5042621.1 FtsK/SpoIIIE domain-containing protein [Streptococcus sp. VTCC 12812]MDM0095580.1 FtsK/SpoIIIE domain-containing protein [Streptococcus sp. VTCC 12813]